MTYTFPDNFLWGSSISAYQAEGGLLEDGRKLSTADFSTRKEHYCDNSVTSDFYHHYTEDIRLLGEMGAKVFRFSLAWPRIIPDGEGEVNEAGVDFYQRVLDELDKYQIEPIVTLFHYDLPLALQEKYGGWADRRVVDAFEAFVRVCFERFGDRIHKFLTINEPDILLMYGGHGLDFTGEEEFIKNRLIINHHFALAHAKAVNLCHEMLPDALIGPVFGYVPVYPESSAPLNAIAAENISDIQNSFFQELFLNGIYMKNVLDYFERKSDAPLIRDGDMDLLKSAKSDILALNYYKSDVARWCPEDTQERAMRGNEGGRKGSIVYPKVPGLYELCANRHLERTDWDWEIDPAGIRYMLRKVYYRYHLPILITENGMANFEHSDGEMIQDDYRIDYMQKHLSECKKAVAEGVELMGYCSWSFIDLLSTSHGFQKRYGLVYVDRDDESERTLKRVPKKSYYWYQKTISNKGKDL